MFYPVMLSHFSPAPVKTDRAVRIPINQSSQSDYEGLQWKLTLDWLILHISGKIAPRV